MEVERLLLAFLWAALVLYGYQLLAAPAEQEADLGPAKPQIVAKGPLARLILPIMQALGPVFEKVGGEGTELKRKLTQAGVGIGVGEFRAARVIALLFFVLTGFLFDQTLDVFPLLSLAIGVLGYFYADIYLSGLRVRRMRQIFRDLPDLLDIIRLAVAAGLDLTSALRVVVENVAQGTLLREFEIVERDIAIGATRIQALERMSARIGMNEFNSFVMAIKQADELGSSIGPILKVQSEMAREKRLQVAEELLAKLPTKLLGPLVICIFPASFIVLFTPLILDFLQSGF